MKREPGEPQAHWIQFDYLLILFVLLTTGFGLVVLYGSTHDVPGRSGYTQLQAKWWLVSLVIFAMAVAVPYRWLKFLGWPLYLVSVLSLLFLILAAKYQWDFGGLVAIKRGGAISWFNLPLPGMSKPLRVQPSEFAKIALVVVLSQWLAWRREHLTTIWECIPPLTLMFIPMLLICLQPDLGTAMIFFPLPFILLFAAGLRWRIVLAGIPIALIGAAVGLFYFSTAEKVPFLRPHQLARIQAFIVPVSQALNPLAGLFNPPGVEEVLFGPPPDQKKDEEEKPKEKKDNWQINNAEMALGSGQIFGKGWGKGKFTRWGFVPEYWTDFIFSTLGEQFGLAGCLSLLGLYLLIVWRALHISVTAPDHFGKYLVVGLLSIVILHVYFNIGMSIKLLPLTGLPLPFLSYGGSFLATNYLIFGLIANVSMRRGES